MKQINQLSSTSQTNISQPKINNVIRLKTGLKAGECYSELYCPLGWDRSGFNWDTGKAICDIPCTNNA